MLHMRIRMTRELEDFEQSSSHLVLFKSSSVRQSLFLTRLKHHILLGYWIWHILKTWILY